jgi:hypothetical protein
MPTKEEYQQNIDYYRTYRKTRECKETAARYYENNKQSLKDRRLRYYYRNREKLLEQQRDRKLAVLTHYGNGRLACVVCGENDSDVLTIDHINNDGAYQRRNKLLMGSSFYRWLISNNFPVGYQTLCANCNLRKEVLRKLKVRSGNNE